MHLKKLIVTGGDRLEFLNRQLTGDLTRLNDGDCCLTAWCNIQGRVSTLLWLQHTTNDIALLVPNETYAKLMPRLGLFILRDDVQISAPKDCWLQNIAISDNGIKLETIASEKPNSWQDQLINSGIPYLISEACDEYLPQTLNLDKLGGLSYSKGCYPGQEIVARTHFRGRLKQRMIKLEGPSRVGDSLHNADGAKIGTVLLSGSKQCLAVVKLAELTGPIQNGNGTIFTVADLPYSVTEQ